MPPWWKDVLDKITGKGKGGPKPKPPKEPVEPAPVEPVEPTPPAPVEPKPPVEPEPTPPPPSGGFLSFPKSASIRISNQSDVVIDGKTFRDLGAGVMAISIYNAKRITIRNCDFDTVAECVYAVDSADITVEGCRYRNITGPAQPRTGANVANFVQFNRVVGGLVARNKGRDGDTEDIVSCFRSDDILVEDNHFESTNWTSKSGSGIALGDGGGSGCIARRNILVNAGQVGAFIAGGQRNQLLDNIIIGEKRVNSNVGIYVWDQYNSSCQGHTVRGNRVLWHKADGSGNHRWNGGNCGEIAGWADNKWGDTSLKADDYRVRL